MRELSILASMGTCLTKSRTKQAYETYFVSQSINILFILLGIYNFGLELSQKGVNSWEMTAKTRNSKLPHLPSRQTPVANRGK